MIDLKVTKYKVQNPVMTNLSSRKPPPTLLEKREVVVGFTFGEILLSPPTPVRNFTMEYGFRKCC